MLGEGIGVRFSNGGINRGDERTLKRDGGSGA